MKRGLTRSQLYWVCATQGIVLLPIFFVLPKLFAIYWLAVAFWRIHLYRKSLQLPGRLIKAAAAILGILSLFFSFTTFLSVETFVAFFIVSFSLKLLEVENKDDTSLLLSLSFIALGAGFLFQQSILAFLYSLICLVLIIHCMMIVYRHHTRSLWSQIRSALSSLVLVVPVAIFLFVVMPRAGQLWYMPSQSKVGNTGFSTTMSPGTFSNLIKSDNVAFRVNFESGELPSPEQRYWRGMVLDNFDGNLWSQIGILRNLSGRGRSSIQAPVEWQMQVSNENTPVRYSVLLEPHLQNVLFMLMGPLAASSNSLQMGFASDVTLRTRVPVAARTRYQMVADYNYRYQTENLDTYLKNINTRLPQSGNDRSREWALALRKTFGEGEQADRAIASEVLKFFNERFTYTLQPPLNEGNIVDEFLFDTQMGFCEHFSGSFVFLMRAAGIPARVVVGYQGGEYNEAQEYMVVRQRDAHAWAEIWLQGSGWVRVDPTAAVAPERIMSGLRDAIGGDEVSLIGGLPSSIRWVGWMQLQLEVLNYRWQQAVINYDENTQSRFFERFLGGQELWRVALLFLGVVAVVMLTYFTIVLFPRRRRYVHPESEIYQTHLDKLARLGFEKQRSESALAFAQRVSKDKPEWESQLMRVAELYNQIAYSASSTDVAALRQLVRGWRP